jgi:hypothetical protein
LQTDEPDGAAAAAAAAATTPLGPRVGARRTLVVKVHDVDGRARSESPAQISDDILGTSGDAVNLRTQMSACSMGRVDFRPGDDGGDVVIDHNLYVAPRGDERHDRHIVRKQRQDERRECDHDEGTGQK